MAKGRGIKRRDFLNGAAISLAAGTSLSPMELFAGSMGKSTPYPPGKNGMRGSQPGSFEIAHALAWEGKKFDIPKQQTENTYDLVVVGGGISGLAAAKFFRDRHGPQSRILVLDNHDDFGGHARRNELDVDGKTLLCYGGSQTIDSPSAYSRTAKQLLRDLAIEVDKFYDYFDQEFDQRFGLKQGIFLDKATFGRDALLTNPWGRYSSNPPTPAEVRASIQAMRYI